MDSKVNLSLLIPLTINNLVETKLKNLKNGRSAYIT